jgi:hypothetical protein
MTKLCVVCGQYKNITEFHLDKKGRFGIKSTCKSCRKKRRFHQPKNKKKLGRNIVVSIITALKKNKENQYFKFFDFSLSELKNHFEGFFNEEINWKTFCIVWTIDFIIPKRYYKFSNLYSQEFKKCFSLKNMRPATFDMIRKKQGRLYWNDIEQYVMFDYLPNSSFEIQGDII